jgi:hypothetical protein
MQEAELSQEGEICEPFGSPCDELMRDTICSASDSRKLILMACSMAFWSAVCVQYSLFLPDPHCSFEKQLRHDDM